MSTALVVDLIQNHFESFQSTSSSTFSYRRLSKEHNTHYNNHDDHLLSRASNRNSQSSVFAKTEKLREELIQNFIIQQTSNLSLSDDTTSTVVDDDDDDDVDDDVDDDKNEAKNQIFEFQNEISNSLIHIINSVLATIVSMELTTHNTFAKSDFYDSSRTLLQYIASFICTKGDGSLTKDVLNHVFQFSSIANYESMRTLICSFVGWCSTHLLECSVQNQPTRTKSKMKKLHRGNDQSLAFLTGGFEEDDDHDSVQKWKFECIEFIVSRILTQRLYDKNQAVRNEAIRSSCTLLSFMLESMTNHRNHDNNDESNDDDNGDNDCESMINLMNEVIDGLKWSMAHDPSFANRSSVLQSIPLRQFIQADDSKSTYIKEMKTSIIESIVERVRDEKVKVRVDALDMLSKVNVEKDLDVDMRCEILRHGLSTRYPATLSSAVRMLCCGWMKTMKFDPISTIALLDPVKNESIAENATRAIISTAGAVGYDFTQPNETNNETKEAVFSSDVTLMTLSDAEIREFKRKVMDCGSIDDGDDSANGLNNKSDDNDDDDVDDDTKCNSHGLCPARMVFMRIMCEMIIQSKALSEYKKTTMIARCVLDVTVLCAVLEKHMNKLQAIEAGDKEVGDESMVKNEDAECFVCLHLLKLATIVDLSEEGSRRHLNSIIHRILSSDDTHDDLIESCVHVLKASSDTETSFLQSISEIVAGTIDLENGTNDEDVDEKKRQHLRAIELLSVSLEKISLEISNNPILQNFSSVILATITDSSLGALVREAGVSCLGRYIILLDEDTVIEKYKPLLLEIASMESEKIEIRAQALLAICDIALRFDRFMSPVAIELSSENTTISVSDVILDCMTNSTKSLLIVAAEVGAKLMFFGRLHDANILAHLITLYFDQVLSSDESFDDVKEVGSPTRLQQLLTVFFPAYCMKSSIGKETLLACVSIALTVVNDKTNKKVRGRRSSQWPITKMLDYIIDLAEQGTRAREPGEPSFMLCIAVAITGFLEQNSDDLSTTFIRSLCKILSNVDLDIGADEKSHLKRLKNSVEELTMHVTDDSALRTLQPLIELVEDVHSDDESESEKESECEGSCSGEEDSLSVEGAPKEDESKHVTAEESGKDDGEDNNDNDNEKESEASITSIVEEENQHNDENSSDSSDIVEDQEMDEINKSMEEIQVEDTSSKAGSRINKNTKRSYDDALPAFAMLGGDSNSNRKESISSSKSSRVSDGDEDLPVFARASASSTRNTRRQTRSKKVVIEESSASEDESSIELSSSQSESSVDESSEDDYSD